MYHKKLKNSHWCTSCPLYNNAIRCSLTYNQPFVPVIVSNAYVRLAQSRAFIFDSRRNYWQLLECRGGILYRTKTSDRDRVYRGGHKSVTTLVRSSDLQIFWSPVRSVKDKRVRCLHYNRLNYCSRIIRTYKHVLFLRLTGTITYPLCAHKYAKCTM